MFWVAVIVVYVFIAALAVFALCCATKYVYEHTKEFYIDEMVVPVFCGILWPVAAPVYGAYLAAMWYANKN